MTWTIINLLAHLAITISLTGIIWFVQLIHYPVMEHLSEKSSFARLHISRTMPLAVSMMVIELATGIVLLWLRPVSVPIWMPVTGLLLMAMFWAITWQGCVPGHFCVRRSGTNEAYAQLMIANGWRSVLMTCRSMLLLSMLWFALLGTD